MVIKVITYIVMAASMVGTIANSCKKRWCFYIWLCTNAFWCVYNFSIGQTAQGLLYTFHFSMAILGIYQWKHNKTDTENIKSLRAENRKLQRRINEQNDIKNEWQCRYFELEAEWQEKYDDEVKHYEYQINRLQAENEALKKGGGDCG